MRPAFAPALTALSALLLLATAPGAPQLGGSTAAPVAAPYDTQADAHAQTEAAFARARSNGHLVMLDFGGNWCPDCRILAGVLAQSKVHDWTSQHFETVLIDVGRETKNLDIAQRWGVKIKAVPAVLILRPDGTLLNGDNVFALSDARSMPQQGVVDLLAAWQSKG